MTTCTECYGEPDLYYGCDDCGAPPRHRLISPAELLRMDRREVTEGRDPAPPADEEDDPVLFAAVPGIKCASCHRPAEWSLPKDDGGLDHYCDDCATDYQW